MELEAMLKALGEPTRLKIFSALLERRCCVRSLSKRLGISESAVSQHLKVMREAGLIAGEKYGYHTHYRPQCEALELLAAEFEEMRRKAASTDGGETVCRCEFRKEKNEE